MKRSVTITFDGRRWQWTLAIEPWALAWEIPARRSVRIDVFGEPYGDDLEVSVGDDGKTIAFENAVFDVQIGDMIEHFDFSHLSSDHPA